jgi:hypothetical protein
MCYTERKHEATQARSAKERGTAMTSGSESQPSSDVRVGAPVVTRDGERLGEVKEFRGPYFKVAAPARPDYWLQLSFACPDSDGHVVMDFGKDDLDAYKVEDIDSDLEGDALNRTDASLLGESGSSTDMTTAP